MSSSSPAPARLAINGFGRIGRLVARLLLRRQIDEGPACAYRVVHVNELEPQGDTEQHAAEISAYLLEFDSVHGRWHGHHVAHVEKEGAQWIRVARSQAGGSPPRGSVGRVAGEDGLSDAVEFTSSTGAADPASIPWRSIGVDVVVECSGVLRKRALLQPMLDQGVRKIVVSAPMKEGVPNVVVGVNDEVYVHEEHAIVTAASCTTNCIAPVVQVMKDVFGIRHGMITTSTT